MQIQAQGIKAWIDGQVDLRLAQLSTARKDTLFPALTDWVLTSSNSTMDVSAAINKPSVFWLIAGPPRIHVAPAGASFAPTSPSLTTGLLANALCGVSVCAYTLARTTTRSYLPVDSKLRSN